MFFVGSVVERCAGVRVELLPLPTPDFTIELDIRGIKLRLSCLQRTVKALDQTRDFVAIEIPVVIVQIVEVWRLAVLRLIVAANLQTSTIDRKSTRLNSS